MNKTREIRFRAWGASNRMIPWSDLIGLHVGTVFQYANNYDLMQYTGINDKNGKEIYDGDILGNENDASLLVWWNDDYACWAAKDPIGREEFGLMVNALDEASSPYEIIGNIYENPKLITGEE